MFEVENGGLSIIGNEKSPSIDSDGNLVMVGTFKHQDGTDMPTQGAQGPAGSNGAQGVKGDQGIKGDQGVKGDQGFRRF